MRTLWTAAEAARQLHVSPRTAQDRAARAIAQGDRRIQRAGPRMLVAPESWWRACFAAPPVPRGIRHPSPRR